MPKVSTKDLPPTSAETPDVLIPHPEIENAFTIETPEEPPVKKLLKKNRYSSYFRMPKNKKPKPLVLNGTPILRCGTIPLWMVLSPKN